MQNGLSISDSVHHRFTKKLWQIVRAWKPGTSDYVTNYDSAIAGIINFCLWHLIYWSALVSIFGLTSKKQMSSD